MNASIQGKVYSRTPNLKVNASVSGFPWSAYYNHTTVILKNTFLIFIMVLFLRICRLHDWKHRMHALKLCSPPPNSLSGLNEFNA